MVPVFYWRAASVSSFPSCTMVYDYADADGTSNHIYSLPEYEYPGMVKVRNMSMSTQGWSRCVTFK